MSGLCSLTCLPMLGRTRARQIQTRGSGGVAGGVAQGTPTSIPRSKLSETSMTSLYTEEEKEEERLQKGIAEFYDKSSGLWEEIWGDHMHHGFYDTNNSASTTTVPLLCDHRSAQLRMIEEALRFAGVPGAS